MEYIGRKHICSLCGSGEVFLCSPVGGVKEGQVWCYSCGQWVKDVMIPFARKVIAQARGQ